MQITIRYFAAIRESIGRAEETREFSAGTTAGDLLATLASDYPVVQQLQRSSLLMVNHEYVEPDFMLSDGDELALIPPVSGGDGRFTVTEQPIILDELIAKVSSPSAGAVVTFTGTVRDHARGRTVTRLDYEAYPEAAEKMLARIGAEIEERWAVEGVAITHRFGQLAIGDISVAIAVSSPHRGEAFEACRHAIERIKQIVPIWKKEHYADGETWIGSEAEYQAAFGHSTRQQTLP